MEDKVWVKGGVSSARVPRQKIKVSRACEGQRAKVDGSGDAARDESAGMEGFSGGCSWLCG